MTSEVLNRSAYCPIRYHQNNNGVQYTANESSRLTWQEARSGVSVPAWKWKISHLKSASSSYSRIGAVTIEHGSWRLYVQTKNGKYSEDYTGIGISVPPVPSVDPKATELALGKFLTNASSALAPFKGGVFLGELRETLNMLRNPASALRNGFSSYLNRARYLTTQYRGKRLRKVLSDTWLEYVYGWRPLINDIRDAAAAYAKLESKVETVFVSGSARTETGGSNVQTNGHHANYLYYFEHTKTVNETKVVFKGVAYARPRGVEVGPAEELRTTCGFNLLEFVPTVWELIPYSFVVDMFSNVGTILNSGLGLTADWVWASQATTCQVKVEVGRRANGASIAYNGCIWTESGGPTKVTRKDYYRVAPSLRLPTLVVELPSSPWSWANLAALISSKV